MSRFLYKDRPGKGLTEASRISKALRFPQPLWDDVRVPMTGFTGGGVRDPDFAKMLDNGSSSTGVYTYQFDAAAEEELFFTCQLPHGYMQYTEIEPHVHWCPTSTNTGTVRWGLEYSIVSVNGTFPNSTIIYAEGAGSGTINDHLIAGFDPDIAGTDIRISAQIMGRLFRDATHANDTYTGDARLLELDFHIRLDTFGSDRTFVKE